MQKLLSLPPNLVQSFHELERVNRTDWFCTSDPVGKKLGSGGGTSWLLEECYNEYQMVLLLESGLKKKKEFFFMRVGKAVVYPAMHLLERFSLRFLCSGGREGNIWEQNLLSLQLPLYEKIMSLAPDKLHTLIASGDVYIRSEKPLQSIPEADVVCYGLWVDPSLATHHGVFASDRKHLEQLVFMLPEAFVGRIGIFIARPHLS